MFVPGRSRLSLLSQSFAHRAAVVFLLGSIVPLGLLALLAHRYVLPRLEGAADEGVLAAILLAAVLSSLSFFVLSRASRETLAEIRGHNQRLHGLLQVASSLNGTGFPDQTAKQALESGASLVSASAGFLFRSREGGEDAPSPAAQWGDEAAQLLESSGPALSALAEDTCRSVKPTLASHPRRGPGPVAAGEPAWTLVAAPLLAQERVLGALLFARDGTLAPFGSIDLDIVAGLSQQVGAALDNARLKESEKNFFTHVTEIVVEALDRFAVQQRGHSRRVAHYCSSIGHELGLAGTRLERLFFAALLHDIGMLKISPEPHATRDAFLSHPELGAQMVAPITAWSDLAPFVLHHHERYDGTGYPGGLLGEDIPLEARIIAVAEAFDAMTHPSTYRVRKELDVALREIEEQAAFQFDPEVVRVFVELVRRGEFEG